MDLYTRFNYTIAKQDRECIPKAIEDVFVGIGSKKTTQPTAKAAKDPGSLVSAESEVDTIKLTDEGQGASFQVKLWDVDVQPTHRAFKKFYESLTPAANHVM